MPGHSQQTHVSALALRQRQTTTWAGVRACRWQGVATAWAVRSQPYPAVRTELPVRFDLAAAIAALLDEQLQLLMPFQDRCFHLALLWLLTLFLAVHFLPPVSGLPLVHVFPELYRREFL